MKRFAAITVIGRDRTGVVARITGFLFEQKRYKNKIINIHPSLLPSFPGPRACRQAHEHGVKIVGVTAHFVSMHLDEGPIIAQGSFPTRSGMSLQQIIAAGQKLEAKVLVKAIRLYLTRRLDVHWGIVKEV